MAENPWAQTTHGGYREGAGRKKRPVSIVEAVAKLSHGAQDYLDLLDGVARGESPGDGKVRVVDQLDAIKLLLGYMYGKPVTPTQSDNKHDVTHRLAPGATLEELEAALESAPDSRPEDTDEVRD